MQRIEFPFEYWIERVTFGLLYAMFRLSTRIFYRGVPGFATDCPFSVLCHELTTCLLYVGPLFGNQVWNDRFFCMFDIMENSFYIVFDYVLHITYCPTVWCYFIFFYLIFMSEMAVSFLHSTSVFPFYIDVVLTFSIVSTMFLYCIYAGIVYPIKRRTTEVNGGIHSLWQYIESWRFWGGWPCWTLWRDVVQVGKLQMFWKHEHTQGAKSQQPM